MRGLRKTCQTIFWLFIAFFLIRALFWEKDLDEHLNNSDLTQESEEDVAYEDEEDEELEEEEEEEEDISEYIGKGVWAAKDKSRREFHSHQIQAFNETRYILLVTVWRSGSTFLGELLARLPGAFYTYEPLVYFDKVPINGTEDNQVDLLEKLFKCDMHQDFLRIASHRANRYLLFRNLRYVTFIRVHKLGG